MATRCVCTKRKKISLMPLEDFACGTESNWSVQCWVSLGLRPVCDVESTPMTCLLTALFHINKTSLYWQPLLDALLEDYTASGPFRTFLEILSSDWSDWAVSMETEPAAKRPRFEHPDFSESSARDKLCVCNAVWNALEGTSVKPCFWQLLSQEDPKKHLQFTLHVS